MSGKRQHYNETFKREVVKYVQEKSKSVPEIAEELNINPNTLNQWLGKYREFENEPVNHMETIREQSQRLHDQQHEIEDLKEEIAILKKAMHIFSKERN
jgi:transposase